MVNTLSKLSELRDSEFGRPRPRHGLKLLYWFAHDYVDFDFDRQIVPKNPKATPETGAYGFREFHNSPVNLLPDHSLPYYEVGNLNCPGRSKWRLPNYVRQDYDGHQYKRNKNRNKDRIIVLLNDYHLDVVYIIEHTDKRNFGRPRQISPVLIERIREFKAVEDFLQKMEAPPNKNPVEPPKKPSYKKRPPPPKNDCCIIL